MRNKKPAGRGDRCHYDRQWMDNEWLSHLRWFAEVVNSRKNRGIRRGQLYNFTASEGCQRRKGLI